MDLYDEIAKLAYEMFEREGRSHGRDLDHWFEAERIVISRYQVQETGGEDKQIEKIEVAEPKKRRQTTRKTKVDKEGQAKTSTAKAQGATRKRTKKI
ncbi:MAG: DUF2934 domain-containing protein [Syntrophorhabdales bacterium]|nr:DUF2934 domain-containing protein [Syntrophorhabdales bacterium]